VSEHERERESDHLVQGLHSSPEAARQMNRHGYLPALLGLLALVAAAVVLLLWLG